MSVVIKDFRSPWIQKFVTYSLFKLKSPELKALACDPADELDHEWRV